MTAPPTMSPARAALELAYLELAPSRPGSLDPFVAALDACAREPQETRDALWIWEARPGIAAVTARALERRRTAEDAQRIRAAVHNLVEPARESPRWVVARTARKVTHLAELLRGSAQPAPPQGRGAALHPASRPAAELFGLLHGAFHHDTSTAGEVTALAVSLKLGEPNGFPGFLGRVQVLRLERILIQCALRGLRSVNGLATALRDQLEQRISPLPATGPRLPQPPSRTLELPPALLADLAGPEAPLPEIRRWLDDLRTDLRTAAGRSSILDFQAFAGHLLHVSVSARHGGNSVQDQTERALESWLAACQPELRAVPAYWQFRAHLAAAIETLSFESREATLDWSLLSLDLSLGELLHAPLDADRRATQIRTFNAYIVAADTARRLDNINIDLVTLNDQMAESGHGINEVDRPAAVLLRGAAGGALTAAVRSFPLEGKMPSGSAGIGLRFVARLAPNGLLDPDSIAALKALALAGMNERQGESNKDFRLALESCDRALKPR